MRRQQVSTRALRRAFTVTPLLQNTLRGVHPIRSRYPPPPSPLEHRFHTYDSTVTHGFGPIKMTLDLYKPDNATTTEEAASCSL